MNLDAARRAYEVTQAFYYQAAIDLANSQLGEPLSDEQLEALRTDYAMRREAFHAAVDRLMEFI